MFLAYICKRPNQGNPIAELFLVLMMVPFQKSLSHVLPYGFIQLARGNHVVQNHICIITTKIIYIAIKSLLHYIQEVQLHQIIIKKKKKKGNLCKKKSIFLSKVIFKNPQNIFKDFTKQANVRLRKAQHADPR